MVLVMSDHRESLPAQKGGPESALQSSATPHIINARLFNTRNLAIIVTGAVFIVAIFRADPKDIPKIVDTIVSSGRVSMIGWIVAVIILVAAIVLIKIMCKVYDREIERIVKERDQLQKQLLEISK